MKERQKLTLFIDRIFFFTFIGCVAVLMFYYYILHEVAHPFVFYIAASSAGLFTIIWLVKGYLLPLRTLDLEYFRNIVIGIIGGIVVWILSTTSKAGFEADFWLSLNELFVKIGIAIFVILIGYIICRHGKPWRFVKSHAY